MIAPAGTRTISVLDSRTLNIATSMSVPQPLADGCTWETSSLHETYVDETTAVLDIAVATSSDSDALDDESDEAKKADGAANGKLRTDRTRKILVDADRRDDEASARDVVADERAPTADLQAFMDLGEEYAGHGERRAAALDRAHAKGDREKSADDRAQLVDDYDNDDDNDAESESVKAP
jgi:hypothetical protein